MNTIKLCTRAVVHNSTFKTKQKKEKKKDGSLLICLDEEIYWKIIFLLF